MDVTETVSMATTLDIFSVPILIRFHSLNMARPKASAPQIPPPLLSSTEPSVINVICTAVERASKYAPTCNDAQNRAGNDEI